MSTDTVTETAIPLCCVMCLTVPEDPAALHNFGYDDLPYWMCVDRYACLDRAVAAQHAAVDAEMGKVAPDPAPGDAQEGPSPAVPPAGDGRQPEAAPGAEQDTAEAAPEAKALEALPAEDGTGTDTA